jgi:hypothetical protein
MGFFSNLDQMVVELVADGCKDEDVVEAVRIEYNGIVNETLVRETIAGVRLREYEPDYDPY